MTYIAAFKNPGLTCIISDMRATRIEDNQKVGFNASLKTGIFFNGCIFGLSGNIERGKEFILTVKDLLHTTMNPSESWSNFKQIISCYNFHNDKDDHFQIILSTRASGTPELFKFDSIKGLNTYGFKNGFISVGSGKKILDNFILEKCIPEMNEFPSAVLENYPFFLCLKLIELSESYGHDRLEKLDVGGLFHFIYQTDMFEAAQKPALYVLSAANLREKIIYLWIYRICRVYNDRGLFVEIWAPPGSKNRRFMTFNSITWPEIPEFLDEAFKKKIIEEAEAQPFYYFCGFGFTNPGERKMPAVHFTTKGDYLFKRNLFSKELDIDDHRAKEIIAQNYEKLIESRAVK